MKIAFYAPMKSPLHPVPSGDRLMARQLMSVLRAMGSEVRLASQFRSYMREPDHALLETARANGEAEALRLIAEWQAEQWRPDIWFCYHPYYKAPDVIGPRIARHFNARYVTVEASYSNRRAEGPWSAWTDELRDGLQSGDVHFFMKQRDLDGLRQASAGAQAQLVHLPPFIDAGPFAELARAPQGAGAVRLVTVAMMRADVKLRSYEFLAAALSRVRSGNWHLAIVGDGEARAAVTAAFAALATERVTFHGELDAAAVRSVLSGSDVFVWPGFGEAYGLAYLEAQAAGCAVIAQRAAGVPEVVRDNQTGILTPQNDAAAFADAVEGLIGDPERIAELGARGRQFVVSERSFATAQAILSKTLTELLR